MWGLMPLTFAQGGLLGSDFTAVTGLFSSVMLYLRLEAHLSE